MWWAYDEHWGHRDGWLDPGCQCQVSRKSLTPFEHGCENPLMPLFSPTRQFWQMVSRHHTSLSHCVASHEVTQHSSQQHADCVGGVSALLIGTGALGDDSRPPTEHWHSQPAKEQGVEARNETKPELQPGCWWLADETARRETVLMCAKKKMKAIFRMGIP